MHLSALAPAGCAHTDATTWAVRDAAFSHPHVGAVAYTQSLLSAWTVCADATQFGDGSPFVSGDAYERMLLNAARGDQALSVSAAELYEAWRIFTPMLHRIDAQRPTPVEHPFGVAAPAGYTEFAAANGVAVEPLQASWGGAAAEG